VAENLAGEPLRVEPLGYSTGELNRRPGLVTWVGVVGLCFSGISLLVNFGIGMASINMISQSRSWPRQFVNVLRLQAKRAGTPAAAAAVAAQLARNQQIAHEMFVSGVTNAITCGADALFALMLLVGAILVLRSKYFGVRVLRIYAVGKIGVDLGAVLVVVAIRMMSTSGMVWLDQMQLNLMGCIFPMVLTALLWGKTFRRLETGSTFSAAEGRPRRFAVIGVVSLCVAIVTMVISMAYVLNAMGILANAVGPRGGGQLAEMYSGISANSPEALRAGLLGIVAFGADLLTGLVLLVGARRLLESDCRGIRTHWIYVWAKVATTALSGAALIGVLSFSAGPSTLALVPIPAAVVYAIVLIFVLSEKGFRVRAVEAAQ
jgi:hypothetical protein